MYSSKNHFASYIVSILKDDTLNDLIPNILEAFDTLTLKKNDYFVKAGHVCKYLCYIKSGILQHSIAISGEEKTTYLALKNAMTSALNSFKNEVVSRKSIKALTDCELQVIDVNTFKHLLKSNRAFYKFYYNLIEHQIFKIDDYRIDLLTLSPEERYKKLLHTDPKLLQQVPLHYLSSFLGISSRHMSRIRKNIK